MVQKNLWKLRAVIIVMQKTTCTRSDRQKQQKKDERKTKSKHSNPNETISKLSLQILHVIIIPSTLDSACVAYSVELYNIKSLTATSSSPVFILASSCNTDSGSILFTYMGTSPVGEPCPPTIARPNP